MNSDGTVVAVSARDNDGVGSGADMSEFSNMLIMIGINWELI